MTARFIGQKLIKQAYEGPLEFSEIEAIERSTNSDHINKCTTDFFVSCSAFCLILSSFFPQNSSPNLFPFSFLSGTRFVNTQI